MYYIGVDLGTSAVKTLLMDSLGKVLRIVSREYPIEFPHPGWSQQRPEDWEAAAFACIPELLESFDRTLVAGIGIGTDMAINGAVARGIADAALRHRYPAHRPASEGF